MPKLHATTSNAPAGNGRCSTSASRKSERDHARGEVDAGRLRALLARGRRQRTGAAGDVE
jgi:hypothetical protein